MFTTYFNRLLFMPNKCQNALTFQSSSQTWSQFSSIASIRSILLQGLESSQIWRYNRSIYKIKIVHFIRKSFDKQKQSNKFYKFKLGFCTKQNYWKTIAQRIMTEVCLNLVSSEVKKVLALFCTIMPRPSDSQGMSKFTSKLVEGVCCT